MVLVGQTFYTFRLLPPLLSADYEWMKNTKLLRNTTNYTLLSEKIIFWTNDLRKHLVKNV
jgi:hypothetical protein